MATLHSYVVSRIMSYCTYITAQDSLAVLFNLHQC